MTFEPCLNDEQFFKMRELTARECATTDQSNSETWIDCVERLVTKTSNQEADQESRQDFRLA